MPFGFSSGDDDCHPDEYIDYTDFDDIVGYSNDWKESLPTFHVQFGVPSVREWVDEQQEDITGTVVTVDKARQAIWNQAVAEIGIL